MAYLKYLSKETNSVLIVCWRMNPDHFYTPCQLQSSYSQNQDKSGH